MLLRGGQRRDEGQHVLAQQQRLLQPPPLLLASTRLASPRLASLPVLPLVPCLSALALHCPIQFSVVLALRQISALCSHGQRLQLSSGSGSTGALLSLCSTAERRFSLDCISCPPPQHLLPSTPFRVDDPQLSAAHGHCVRCAVCSACLCCAWHEGCSLQCVGAVVSAAAAQADDSAVAARARSADVNNGDRRCRPCGAGGGVSSAPLREATPDHRNLHAPLLPPISLRNHRRRPPPSPALPLQPQLTTPAIFLPTPLPQASPHLPLISPHSPPPLPPFPSAAPSCTRCWRSWINSRSSRHPQHPPPRPHLSPTLSRRRCTPLLPSTHIPPTPTPLNSLPFPTPPTPPSPPSCHPHPSSPLPASPTHTPPPPPPIPSTPTLSPPPSPHPSAPPPASVLLASSSLPLVTMLRRGLLRLGWCMRGRVGMGWGMVVWGRGCRDRVWVDG